MLKLLSLLAFLAAGFLIWQRYQPLSFSSAPNTESTNQSGVPQTISIPDLNLNLPVFPGEIKDKRWPVTPLGVIFLTSSPASNAIIYGHNWPNLLGHLKKAQLGQTVNINYTNGQTQKYIISEVKTVGPNATDILEPFGDNRLTIYTCTGFLDTKRLVVVAKVLSN